ncbi:MAG: hypothetical protein OXI57_06840 [Rhodospirillales bacterium]|nr:hypothetical protein [Rhodospirillales bacterium]
MDLIVTMDDATSEICSAFFVDEEGTMSSFRALSEVIQDRGRFCSLYADRASHYWHTPDAGGTVDKDKPTQVGRALRQLGIELIPAYSPEARRQSERMFGTLQRRLPQELRLAGITGIAGANRFLREVYLTLHNAGFQVMPEAEGSAFIPFTGALDDILCIQEERTVSDDNTVRYRGLSLQLPPDRHRHHYVKARVRVHEYPDGTLAVFHGCGATNRMRGHAVLVVAELVQRMARIGAVAPVARGEAIEAVEPVIDRLGHPALEDLGERLTPQRAVALAPLQAVRLHRLHDLKGHR